MFLLKEVLKCWAIPHHSTPTTHAQLRPYAAQINIVIVGKNGGGLTSTSCSKKTIAATAAKSTVVSGSSRCIQRMSIRPNRPSTGQDMLGCKSCAITGKRLHSSVRVFAHRIRHVSEKKSSTGAVAAARHIHHTTNRPTRYRYTHPFKPTLFPSLQSSTTMVRKSSDDAKVKAFRKALQDKNAKAEAKKAEAKKEAKKAKSEPSSRTTRGGCQGLQGLQAPQAL